MDDEAGDLARTGSSWAAEAMAVGEACKHTYMNTLVCARVHAHAHARMSANMIGQIDRRTHAHTHTLRGGRQADIARLSWLGLPSCRAGQVCSGQERQQ